MAHVEALSPFLGDRVWSQPVDAETVIGPDGVPIMVDKPPSRSASARVDQRVAAVSPPNPSRYRSRPRAATVDGSDAPSQISQDIDATNSGQGSGPHSLRRRRSRRNSRSSRRQSSQGPPSIKDANQLPYVYLENCTQREFEIIMMISDILWERGDSPVGLLGTRLHAKTQDHNLPTHFKEAYGGLKKFVSRWPSLFVLHTDHRYNPKVGLLGWPKSTVYPSRPPTGAPFAAVNGSGQGGARARRRRANKVFQQAGAHRVHGGGFSSVPPGFSPYSQTQALSLQYSPHGTPYQGVIDSLASHERSFALPPTRDRAATYSGIMPSPQPMIHHEGARPHAMSSFSPPYSDFSRGFSRGDGEFAEPLPPRSRSPPRKMQVEIGDPFNDLELEDYFLLGGRSHAASDPGPRPYVEPSPLDMPPSSSLGYARRARFVPRNSPATHTEHRDGAEPNSTSGAQDYKFASPKSQHVLSRENHISASASSTPSNKSNSAASSSTDAHLQPPAASNSAEDRGPSARTPSPSSHGRVVATDAHAAVTPRSAAQQADLLRVRAMKMHAAAHQERSRAHLAPRPEFAFMEEDDMFGDYPTTRARAHSYDVASAPRPAALHLPPSSPYYPHISPRHGFDSHALAPLPPLTPPYGSIPLSPSEASSSHFSGRDQGFDRPYGLRAGDLYQSGARPQAKHSGGVFFPKTQPLPHRGASDPTSASGQTGFSLSKMMSALSVDDGGTKRGIVRSDAAPDAKFLNAPLNGVGVGRSRSASSPALPQGVLSRNAGNGTPLAGPQVLSGAEAQK